MKPVRYTAVLVCLLLYTAGAPAGAAGQDVDTLLAACPGGADWLAAEQARRASLKLPPQAPPRLPAFREELLRMESEDQAVRAPFTSGRVPTKQEEAALRATDARNLARLKEITRRNGFPKAADVGRDGVAAAWLLVQHADADPAFQEQILSELEGLGDADGISSEQIALLTDRVLLAQGRPQRYGSQYGGKPGTRPAMRPVEDPEGLDARRARMHMMPSATYACFLERMGMGAGAR